jgi:hypothetical protein
MTQYVVVSDRLELPKGRRFTTLAGVEAGQLALISLEGWLIAGRFYADVAGCDWLVLPGLLIEMTGKLSYRVVGRVVPADPEAVHLNWKRALP